MATKTPQRRAPQKNAGCSALGRTRQRVPVKRHESRLKRLSAHRQSYSTPGPGAYNMQTALGRTTISTKPSAPSFAFGGKLCKISRNETGPQKLAHQFKDNPGPDTYSRSAMLGVQVNSAKPSAPRGRFSKASRSEQSKLYSVDSDGKQMFEAPLNAKVGPGSYETQVGCELGNGGLFESTPPAWGFGVSERKPMTNDTG